MAVDPKLRAPLRDGGRDHLAHLSGYVAAEEWRLAGEHFVQGCADRIDIVRRRWIFAEKLLRTHVVQRAAGGPHADISHRVAERAGDSKVGDLELLFTVHHQVRWLQIAMHKTGGFVRVSKRVAPRHDPRRDLVDFKTFRRLFHAQRRKRRPVHIFHRNSGCPFVFNEIKNTNDVWVRKHQAFARLSFQILMGRGIETNRLRHEFERDETIEPFVTGQPDDAHSAASEDFLQGRTIKELRPPTTPRLVWSPSTSSSGTSVYIIWGK